MASKLGHNAFTVQEATNASAFNDYFYEDMAYATDTFSFTAANITSSQPAKKIVLYEGDGATVEDDDTFTIKLNGETATNKSIIITGLNLPFTIEGILMTSLVITVPDGDTTSSDSLSVLSFH